VRGRTLVPSAPWPMPRRRVASSGSLAFPGFLPRPGVGRFQLRSLPWKQLPFGLRSRAVPLDVRRRLPLLPARLSPGSLSWGSSKIASPSTWAAGVHSRSRFPWGLATFRQSFGSSLPRDGSRSTFAVSHRLDGLLRRLPRGSVAPRCRSWGSPGFGPPIRCPRGLSLRSSLAGEPLGFPRNLPRGRFLGLGPVSFLTGAFTLQSISLARSRASCEASCPPAVRLPVSRSVRLQGFHPRVESVALRRRCRCLALVALMGFSSD